MNLWYRYSPRLLVVTHGWTCAVNASGNSNCETYQVVNVIDVRKTASKAGGYCYGKRVMYIDAHNFSPLWEELCDTQMSLWKFQTTLPQRVDVPGAGPVVTPGVDVELIWDIQRNHASAGGKSAGSVYVNEQAPAEFHDVARYTTPADGSCKPFANLSALGSPAGLTFSSNSSVMLVTVSPGEIVSSRKQPKVLIVSVAADGKVDPKPVATGLTTPLGLDVAPPGFGDYAGQISSLT